MELKDQVPGVGSKPLPLIVPTPLTSRNVPLGFCETTIDELRSKVKPPICHNIGFAGPGAGVAGVPELKIHGAPIVAGSPGSIENVGFAKSPLRCKTTELFQTVTLVAVARDVVSYVTTPPKSMSPCIGAA